MTARKLEGAAAACGKSTWPECPRCTSQDLWRNGVTGGGKQQWRCKTCGRVFVLDPYINSDVRLIADRMIAAGIAVPLAAEVLHGYVSVRWLYNRKRGFCG